MKQKKFAILVLLFILVMPVFSRAGSSDTINYLKNQTQDAWITQALVSLGGENISTSHLESVNGTMATDYAKTIMALSSLGKNPGTFGNIDYIAKLKTYFTDSQMGDTSLLNDDMWSILAFASANEQGEETEGAKNYLLQNQNRDGGWSYAVGGESDSNDTAAAIIALLETGVAKTDPAIIKAKNYLGSIQNSDGGFGWTAGSNSDSGSGAWVIMALNKLGEEMSEWEKNGYSPLDHLKTLENTDGSYWWVEPGTSDFNNKAMTAYAAIALSGKSFPVAYFDGSAFPDGYSLRVEGKDKNICDTTVEGGSAFELLENASGKCNFTYMVEETSYGSYLKQVNNEAAEGLNGWMYLVNYESPSVGASEYILGEGDEVVFYYGEWGVLPSRLTAAAQEIDSGEAANIILEYYQENNWLPLADADVFAGGEIYRTNSDGEISLELPDGFYEIFAEKEGYVRSNKILLNVGGGVAQNLDLAVEIIQPDEPVVGGESLIFEISTDKLDFGKMNPGESRQDEVTLKNSGTVDLSVDASVSGDGVFSDNIKINNDGWTVFSETLNAGVHKNANVELSVPSSYLGAGVKTGEIIFWAEPK